MEGWLDQVKLKEIWIGVKAGVVTGLLLGGFLVPLLIITQQGLDRYVGSGSLFALSNSTSASVILLMIGSTAIYAALILAIVGVLFVFVRKWMPGDSLTVKACAFFLLLWLVTFVFRVPAYLRGISADIFVLEVISLIWVQVCAVVFARLLTRFS